MSSNQPAGIQKQKKTLRKARIQVKQRKNLNLQREEGGGDYNIWYHKFLGQGRDRPFNEPATTRVSIKKDSGWTIACSEKEAYFCLFFARGCCSSGPDCHFLHRLPTKSDEQRIPITKDVFGRDKHATDREDMGGTGSFNRECRTLYVAGLKNVSNLQQLLIDNFKEFGELEYVRAFPDRCYAFVKFKLRLCAEFAKEAMLNQSLTDNPDPNKREVLQIKWATDDQNPIAARRNELELKTKLIEKLASEVSAKDYAFNYPLNYSAPDALPLPSNVVEQQQAPTLVQLIQEQTSKIPSLTSSVPPAPGTISNPVVEESETAEQKRLNYFHFIHATMAENQAKLQKISNESKEIYEQRKILDSNAVDAYPNTDSNFRGS
jgi:invasion protein IalB